MTETSGDGTDRTDATPETVPDASGTVDPEAVERAVEHLNASERLVVFTGAGVSTESGVPDFRSPGGLWDRYDPSDFTIQALRRAPVAYWERRLQMAEEREFD